MAKYMGGKNSQKHVRYSAIRPSVSFCLALVKICNFGASLQKNSRTVILQIVHFDWMSHIQSCSKIANTCTSES